VDFRIFLTGGVGDGVVGNSSFSSELTLPKLDLEADLLGGLVDGGEGLVGSLALNCVLGKVLNSGDGGWGEFFGCGEVTFLDFVFEDPLSNALIRSAIGIEPTAESLDIVPSTRDLISCRSESSNY